MKKLSKPGSNTFQPKAPTKPRSNFFQRRVPLWLLFVLTGAVTVALLLFDIPTRKATSTPHASAVASLPAMFSGEFNQHRLKDYKFISPLLLVDIKHESAAFNDLKSSLTTLIGQEKLEGKINSASVYMKKCGSIEWFAVNPDEGFYTASLMKVAVLITILKMSENTPGYLDKIYSYKHADAGILPQTYDQKTIEPGHDYKMRDLLYYMIVYSDNYASDILNGEMNLDIYKKLFTDIGIEGYDPYDQFRKLKAEDVGKLFRLLYNASYLTKDNSEYALSLLSQSSFKDGLVKELPGNVVVAHKFAEAGGNEENQLHDAGIVYDGTTPYLLVVMTRGKKLPDLSQSIGEISKKVYDYMNQKVTN